MWHQARPRKVTGKPASKKDKKMKGLAITILLGILEIAAVATSNDTLLKDGPQQVVAIRKEEDGLQAEVLVEAERADLVDLEPTAPAADLV